MRKDNSVGTYLETLSLLLLLLLQSIGVQAQTDVRLSSLYSWLFVNNNKLFIMFCYIVTYHVEILYHAESIPAVDL